MAHANICSRTTQIQTAIIALVPGKTACANITNTDLAGITGLTVANDSTLTTLTSGDFAGLTGLTLLHLHNNKLSSLPTGVFDALDSLEWLRLDNNRLSSLPAGVFDNLGNLTTLQLYFNRLSSLPAGVFDNLGNLTTLHLGVNNLSSLPAGVFDNLGKLDILHLNQNSLSSLNEDIFDNLDALTFLDLYSNDLSSLPAGLFDELGNLGSLVLSYNKLSSLPTGVFNSLANLKWLVLHANNLSSLPAGVFDNLTLLENLYLHNNRLSGTIPALSTTLQRLHLAGNPITGWPSNLGSLTNLSNLSLCETSLTTTATLPAALETRCTNGDLTVWSCLDIDDATATEGTALSFSVEHSTWPVRGSATAQALTVGYSTSDGTATSADYTGTTTGSLTIPANTDTTTWTKSANISVSTTDDTVAEPDETFTVTLANMNNVIEVRWDATGTITDNDGALSIANASATEGGDKGGLATFTVSLNRALSKQVTVNYATADRSATAPGDYTATSGTLTFAAGETSKTIAVPVIDDSIDERDETFSVTLSNPTNAIVSVTTATGTIIDNDAAPTLSIADTSVIEGNSGESIATFTLSLSHRSSKAVAVDFATSNGTATAGSDYVAQDTTLIGLGNSTTATISVKVKGDTVEEADETFSVTLSNPTNATLSATAKTATGTIRNDDTTLSLATQTVSVAEGNSGTTTANFPVRLSRASAKTVTVHYATADGTATAPGDYTATTGTLTFAAGNTSKTIPVTVQGDTVVEPDETFTLTLSNAANARLGTATATGTITNDDEAPLVPPDDGGGGGDGGGDGGGGGSGGGDSEPAVVRGFFESPAPGAVVSGIDVIRGWSFAEETGVGIRQVEWYLDGRRMAVIPCCSSRADVTRAHPTLPRANTGQSGWGITWNWGNLTAGSHTVQVVVTSTDGGRWASDTRPLTVVKPGGIAYATAFSLAEAEVWLDNEQVVLSGVVLGDADTEQEIEARYAWQTGAQGLRLVASQPLATARLQPVGLERLLAGILRWGRQVWSPGSVTANDGITRAHEAPADGAQVAGIDIIRGWAFPDDVTDEIATVTVQIDATPGSAPCCSTRADVAGAFPDQANAELSGWGLVTNYGNLAEGEHTVGVQITTAAGLATPLETRTVTVSRLGGYAYVDRFDLSAAEVELEGEELILSGVEVRNAAAPEQTRTIAVRLQWSQAVQGLVIVDTAIMP